MNNFNKYIGLPWIAGASGPDTFDCWGFVRYVLKNNPRCFIWASQHCEKFAFNPIRDAF